MPITIHHLALHRGMRSTTGSDGSYSQADYNTAGLEIMGGCSVCGASIAAYNAFPAKDGTWKCADHIGNKGWDSAAVADRDIFKDRAVPAPPNTEVNEATVAALLRDIAQDALATANNIAFAAPDCIDGPAVSRLREVTAQYRREVEMAIHLAMRRCDERTPAQQGDARKRLDRVTEELRNAGYEAGKTGDNGSEPDETGA